MKRIALAGNPNCGKTTLFNTLTGSTAHVGNWPGVTVDKKEGLYKKSKEVLSIIDLPGIYSLSPYTSEEVISRDYLLEEKPDCVVNIVDATNLERNLYLTTQLLEIDVPVVIALNMMDMIRKNGESIDPAVLERKTGVPVICISAQKEENLTLLMDTVYNESLKQRKGTTVLEKGALSHLISDCKAAFVGLKVENALFHAIKLVENDEIEARNHPDLVNIVVEFKKTFKDETFGDDLEAIVADSRYQYISLNYAAAKTTQTKSSKEKFTKSDRIDKILTHRWAGIPIFLVILFLIFHFTFSENLFYLGGLFNNIAPSFEGSIFEGLIWTDAGVNSIGVILQSFVTNITDWFTGIVGGWLSSSPTWVSGLICDGILAGVFSVLSFVPQILLLFLFFSILEDTGYMARVAFILDRIFRKFGLSGRAFMPMIMGFGCSVPAMINTRTLADEKERVATIRVIPFFSCGAKLPILTAIAGAVCQVFSFPNVDIITYSMYVLGIATAIVTIILMRSTTMRGAVPPFIMELPTYHIPQFKSLMLHLWDKLKHYVVKAFTIILASTIVIWFLQSFTWNWQYIEMVNVADLTHETFTSKLDDEGFAAQVQALDAEYVLTEGESQLTFDVVVGTLAELEELEDKTTEETASLIAYTEVVELVFIEALAEYVILVNDQNYIDTSSSILAGVGQLVQPIFTPLGFGSNLDRDNGWVFGVSAITGLIAKENVISTFAVLAQCTTNSVESLEKFKEVYFSIHDDEGVHASVQMIQNAGVGNHWPILIAFIVFNMTTIPCFAAVATAKAELPNKKIGKTLLFWIATSYFASMMVYLVLSWWWTSFVFAGLFVGLGFGIHFFNKYRDTKRRAGV